MQRKLGIILQVVGLLASGLVWLPVPEQVTRFEVAKSGWSFQLTHPFFLRSSDGGVLALQVTPPGSADSRVITARLDLPDIQVESSEAGETVAPGGSAHFSWEIPPVVPGVYEGRIWVYDGVARTVISARAVQLRILEPGSTLLWVLRVLFFFLAIGGGVMVCLRPANRGLKLRVP